MKLNRIAKAGLSVLIVVIIAAAAVTAGAANVTTIRIVHPAGEIYQKMFEQLSDSFTKIHPEIQVKIEPTDWTDYGPRMIMQSAAGTGPDLFYQGTAGPFAYRRVAMDLDILIKNDKTFALSDYEPSSLLGYIYRGKLYGLPTFYSPYVLFYNKDLFDKFHVAYPTENWTLNDFLAAAKKLTVDENNDGKPEYWGFKAINHINSAIEFIRMYGGDFFDQKTGKYILTSTKSLNGFQYFIDLIYKHHVSPTPMEDAAAMGGINFESGKVAMHMASGFGLPGMRNLAFNWDIQEVPKGPAGRAVCGPIGGFIMSAGGKHIQEAWTVLKYYTGPEAMKLYAATRTSIPALKSAASLFIDPGIKPQHQDIFLKAVKYARPTFVEPYGDEVIIAITPDFDAIFNGKKTPAEALKASEPQVQAIIAKYQN